MSAKSEIGWTGASWPAVTGCEAVNDDCTFCYAARETASRLKHHPAYEGLAFYPEAGGPAQFTGEVRCNYDRLDWPLRWSPRMVFLSSMGDIFHRDVPESFIADLFAVMALARGHTYQVLTKRPQRMARLLCDTERWLGLLDDAMARRGKGAFAEHVPSSLYPMPWVWLGTSIGEDKYSFFGDHLRATPAAVRWLSLEPLRGPLPSLDLTGIDWVVVGGESGGKVARPMDPAWALDLMGRCRDAGIPFFFKQTGFHLARQWGLHSLAGKVPEEWPEELRVQHYPEQP